MAGVGCAQVQVIRKPKVVILSSGDELVDIYDELDPGKIRDTNSYALAGLVKQMGGLAIRLPIAKDTLESVRALYRRALEINPDLIISSAGVSVGAADLVRVVMNELGDIDFWRINMRPGKPLAYGTPARYSLFWIARQSGLQHGHLRGSCPSGLYRKSPDVNSATRP